jgi:uncharacterized protein (TIGR00251 family)
VALLTLKVVPGAKQTEVAGWHGDAIKIRLQAPPVDGKANQALLDFLANKLDVPRNTIRIVRGATNTLKTVEIRALDVETLETRLIL